MLEQKQKMIRKIEGSINIEVDKLRENLDKLPSDKNTPIYVLCAGTIEHM